MTSRAQFRPRAGCFPQFEPSESGAWWPACICGWMHHRPFGPADVGELVTAWRTYHMGPT